MATLVRLAIEPVVGSKLVFATYAPILPASAIVGGLRTGLLALALSMLLAWYLFLPPEFTFFLTGADALQLVFFLAFESPLVVFAWLMHEALRTLVDQRRQIEQALAREERQQALIVGELEHRIGNLFGLVEGLATRTFKGADEEAKQAFCARGRPASGLEDRHRDPDSERPVRSATRAV